MFILKDTSVKSNFVMKKLKYFTHKDRISNKIEKRFFKKNRAFGLHVQQM